MPANADMPILIVDDTKFSAAVILKCLSEGDYENVRHVDNAEDALDLLERYPIPIVIADWQMPEIDGLALTRKIRQLDEKLHRYTYILMLTAKDGEDHLSLAFNEGIDDFVNKSAMKQQLLPRLFAASRITAKQKLEQNRKHKLTKEKSLLEKQNHQLKSKLTIDGLTGFNNKSSAEQKLASHLEYTQSRGGTCCLIVIKIMLKKHGLNQLPTTILQEIIQGVGLRLKSSVRPLDELARLSPFEFGIITQFPDTDETRAFAFKRIHTLLTQKAFKTNMGYQQIDISLSIVTSTAEESVTPTDMLSKAKSLIDSTNESKNIEVYAFNSEKEQVR
ncbi:MAG: response regulator [Cellvibrionales bacterium]|nr:response regulator [Cellvibrionales bacterium]